MTPEQSTLGKAVAYTAEYDPTLLFPIPRQAGRDAIGLHGALPFFGVDIWNAYELSWLTPRGKPQIALLRAMVPADSPNIIESKSFKLYLGSFAQTSIASVDDLAATLRHDLSAVAGAPVEVALTSPDAFARLPFEELSGVDIDRLDLDTQIYTPNATLLQAAFDAAPVEETLVSNLLKSNCPVTGQPDWASVQIYYSGAQIDQAGLLRYIISFRQHTGFHEQCVEQIFTDIQTHCRPSKLAVYARYTRRGGLDINPFRTNCTMPLPDNARTARQ